MGSLGGVTTMLAVKLLIFSAICVASSFASSFPCSCNGVTNNRGGECKTTYRGKKWCYTSDCPDAKRSIRDPRLKWSFSPCICPGNHAEPTSGDPCDGYGQLTCEYGTECCCGDPEDCGA